jgi:hypothetical protein
MVASARVQAIHTRQPNFATEPIGQDHSMTVKLDSGKTAEVSSEKSRYIDYGYAVDGLKNLRAERVIATGDGLSQ